MVPREIKRQKCEIYSRVVGYLSPVNRWNKGKRNEFNDRRVFNMAPGGKDKLK